MNAQLRTIKMDDELRTIYTPGGMISEVFPKTLQDLLGLDGKHIIVQHD